MSITVALLFWGKVGGPQPVRYLTRIVMIMFCQVTAVLMVFVMVNNANLIYGNWDDLLGTGNHVRAVPVVAPVDPAAAAGGKTCSPER
ncbi:esterase, partial [Kitasatospora sp. NPDC057512]